MKKKTHINVIHVIIIYKDCTMYLKTVKHMGKEKQAGEKNIKNMVKTGTKVRPPPLSALPHHLLVHPSPPNCSMTSTGTRSKNR